MSRAMWVGGYLVAIVAANLITTHFAERGHPEASVYTAFFLVAATFVVRDRLHDAWDRHRVLKLGALIAAGSVLAYVANPGSARIALASCAAFAVAESVDGLVYHAARRHPWLVRSNASNIVGAVADSAVFVAIAFPGFLVLVAFEQMTAKIAGGLLFSMLLASRRERVLEPA